MFHSLELLTKDTLDEVSARCVLRGILDCVTTYSFIYQRTDKDAGQRKICGCMVNKDIGMYNTCHHLCVYCYANTSKDVVLRNKDKHSDDCESVIG